MQPDRFTIRAQEALAEAVRLAQSAGNPQVTPAHVLEALLADPDGIALSLLRKLGGEIAAIRGPLSASLDALPVLGSAASTCAGVTCGLPALCASRTASASASWARIVKRSGCIKI